MLTRADLSKIQTDAISAIQSRLKLAVWSKPGSGKTVIALTAVEDMYLSRTLIVGTKRIVEHVWRQEAARWEHLQHVEMELLTGTPAQRERKLRESDKRYMLINYELLPWLLDTLKRDLSMFDAVIFDELSKMKAAGAKRFKKMRLPILQVPIRIGLTGTPRGNSMMGLWAQTYCTNGPVLGETFTHFKTRYFFPVDQRRVIWVPYADTEDRLRQKMKPYAYVTPPEAASPEAKVNPIPVGIPSAVRKMYDTLERDLTVDHKGVEVTAIEPAQMRNKLIQIASGAIYHGFDKEWLHIHDAKLDALDDMIDDLQGEQLLIFFRYRHELERIQSRISDVVGIDQVDAWLAGKNQNLCVHPASAAHGLNLHIGGASQACWFSLPESQELWEQGNRRLARTGQKKQAVSHVLYAVNTKEEKVAEGLRSHGRLQDLLMETVHDQDGDRIDTNPSGHI